MTVVITNVKTDVEDAESRDEKRWMERQNKKASEGKKKEERARINTYVAMCVMLSWDASFVGYPCCFRVVDVNNLMCFCLGSLTDLAYKYDPRIIKMNEQIEEDK